MIRGGEVKISVPSTLANPSPHEVSILIRRAKRVEIIHIVTQRNNNLLRNVFLNFILSFAFQPLNFYISKFSKRI